MQSLFVDGYSYSHSTGKSGRQCTKAEWLDNLSSSGTIMEWWEQSLAVKHDPRRPNRLITGVPCRVVFSQGNDADPCHHCEGPPKLFVSFNVLAVATTRP